MRTACRERYFTTGTNVKPMLRQRTAGAPLASIGLMPDVILGANHPI